MRSRATDRTGGDLLRGAAAGAAALLVALLAGCGEQEAEAQATQAGTPTTLDCPETARAVLLPEGFRAPLPDGTVVVAVQHRDHGRTVVTGVVPAAEKDVLAGLQKAYPAAGLSLTDGETEAHDAESNFSGTGLTGRWGIRVLENCSPEATRIDLVIRRS